MSTMFRKTLTATLIASAFSTAFLSTAACAGEAEILKKIEALEAEIKALKADAAASKAAPLVTDKATAGYTKVDKGYLTWGSNDGNYELKLDGRVQLDVGSVDSDNNHLTSDSSFRRVRLGLKGKFFKDWESEFDVDFAGNEVTLKDMWLSYNAIPNTEIKLGHFKPHFSMDQVTSSRVATYLESSLATDYIAPSRRIGLAAAYSNNWLFMGGGFFGDKASSAIDPDSKDNAAASGQSELIGYSLRVVAQPFWRTNNNRVFHVGLNLLNQRPRTQSPEEYDPSVAITCSKLPANPASATPTCKATYAATKSSAKYRSMKFAVVAENELMGADLDVLDTRLYGATDAFTSGLELAFKYDKHILTGEYLNTSVKASSEGYTTSIPDAKFNSYYIAYSYFLNGDRVYEAGDAEFGRVEGRNALELTARYSMADLNDAHGGTKTKFDVSAPIDAVAPVIGVFGGKANVATVGVNWYPNPNLMFRLNYLNIKLDEHTTLGKDTINVLGLRSQFTF